MTRHGLLLSAAAAALLAQPLVASADTTISSSGNQTVTTATDGNITIDQNGAVSVKNSTGAAVVVNSNNSLQNLGSISNYDTGGAIALQVDTSVGNIVAPAAGISSYSSIDVSGQGDTKSAILISGGNTYFGNITFGTLQAQATTGGQQIVSSSSIQVQGDNSTAFYLVQGTKIDGDIVFAGQINQSGDIKNTNNGGSIMIDLDGQVNGNVIFDNTTQAINSGNLTTAVTVLGGIRSCASDSANFASGFACSTSSSAAGLGSFVNQGSIIVTGTLYPNSKYVNSESASAIVIANGIDGGFINDGPATADPSTFSATISSNGLVANPTLVIDPSLSVTPTQTSIRGPVNIGLVPIAIDPDGGANGYSFINRGTISASPIDPMQNSAAVYIAGSSPTNYTYLGTSNYNSALAAIAAGTSISGSGGLLNTGTIASIASTNQQNAKLNNATLQQALVSTNALTIGAYAVIPRLDVLAEPTSGSAYTAGTISATVSGSGRGSAVAVAIAQYAIVPEITVGQRANITATVNTTTISPTSDIANATTPFILTSEAIVDASNTLARINNAGSIIAATTVLTPASGAVAITTVRAVDLSSSANVTTVINNSGTMLGDILFSAAGNGNTLNVGNTGAGVTDHTGAANTANGIPNTPNNYAIVAQRIDAQLAGAAPITETGFINFGAGTGNQLHIGGFGYVNSAISAAPGGLDVTVENSGALYISTSNAVPTLNARNFTIANNGTLGLTITQLNTNSILPAVLVQNAASIDPNAKIGLQFGSFISSGVTAASVNNPSQQNIILVSAPTGTSFSGVIANQNPILSQEIPFLFEATSNPLAQGTAANGNTTLELHLRPRVPGALNADGTAGLGLSGDALKEFPNTAAALSNDTLLGTAIASNLTVYNTSGVPTSGINIPASQQRAQQAFSQFGPDTSGGAREIAIMLTDEASGPVAARQRLLRSFSDQPGDLTLWGEEFSGMINNKGRVDADGTLTNYKDHGFGFAVGVDGGSPQTGWYGGAFTFYTGDSTETLPRDSITHTQWYMFTGYTQWRGKHLFLDTQASVAYGDFRGDRYISIGTENRDALGKRGALMGALGGNTGVMMHFGPLEVDPHVSLDGLVMREEGYTETGGGEGFNLAVAPYYANSFRGALGADFKSGFSVWDIGFSPEARIGYRYDLANSPVKLKAGFASTGGLGTVGNTLQFVGPDPDTGNFIGGLGLGASTDTWQLGVNYDWLRGSNGSTTQLGTFTLLGRI